MGEELRLVCKEGRGRGRHTGHGAHEASWTRPAARMQRVLLGRLHGRPQEGLRPREGRFRSSGRGVRPGRTPEHAHVTARA